MGRTDIKVSKSDKLFIKTDIITCMMIQWSVLLFLTALLCYLSIWFLIPMTCIFIVSCFSDITEKILLVCQPNKHYIIVDRETIILKRWKEIKTYKLDQIGIVYLSMRKTLDSPPRLVITTKDKNEVLEYLHIRKKDAQKIQAYLGKQL